MLKLLTRNFVWLCILALMIFVSPFYILANRFSSSYSSKLPEGYATALILGAGIQNNQPSWVLRERLDTALALYRLEKIKTILVSGSNPDQYYNEPAVMKKYLVEQGVSDSDVVQDFGGRRTIDSCWRAKNVFKLEKIVLITQYFHLPRGSYVCKQMGLDVYSVIARDSSTSVTLFGYFREFPSTWQAIWDSSFDYKPVIGGNGSEEKLE